MTEVPSVPAEREVFYPQEENLGKNCQFWNMNGSLHCDFPKAELIGRTSCEGVVDDVCLFLKDGREPTSLTEQQKIELKTRAPGWDDKSYIPPGDTV